jgi:hypothetical protein
MQVDCPVCAKVGLLQKITPRYFRIRHSLKDPHYSPYWGRTYYTRHFTYCRVATEWAQEQINNEKQRQEESLKQLSAILCKTE